jgi:hypothetical protein
MTEIDSHKLNEEKELCNRCLENGRIYVDHKAHYYSEHFPTIPCPDCDGEGYLAVEKLIDAEDNDGR